MLFFTHQVFSKILRGYLLNMSKENILNFTTLKIWYSNIGTNCCKNYDRIWYYSASLSGVRY